MRQKYTDDDIDFLKLHYPIGDWDSIFDRFPNVTKQAICSKMSKMKIPYNAKRKSCKNVGKKKWSNDEIEIIKVYYPNYELDYVIKLLPGRSKDAIVIAANKLGVLSYNKRQTLWTKEQEQYIAEHWELEPDKIMAVKLKRTFRAVKCKREQMGFFRRDMTTFTYTNLSKYLRGQNQKWKKDSMKECDYQCVLTGSKNFEIHHLYGVSNIVEDIFKNNEHLRQESFSEYSEEELSFILQLFILEQDKYPLGECVDKQLHTMFHSLYGQYYNTPDQWYRFKEDYAKGVYNN